MVRFSTVTFWLSFISETASVGTTTERTARCCPSDTTRCSRLCLTLFSWPEYVLTTYQRNIQKLLHEDGEGASTCPLIQGSEDKFDDFLGDIVGQAKVETGDGD